MSEEDAEATRAILAATQARRVMGACDCRECAEALADAIIAYEPPGVSGER